MTEQLNNRLLYCQQGPLTCSLYSKAQTYQPICFRVFGLTAAFPLSQTFSSRLPSGHSHLKSNVTFSGTFSAPLAVNFQPPTELLHNSIPFYFNYSVFIRNLKKYISWLTWLGLHFLF